jgi:hypothetical protein
LVGLRVVVIQLEHFRGMDRAEYPNEECSGWAHLAGGDTVILAASDSNITV